ncbi:MAG: helix-turn-helix transcriptional regulator [Clostridia bacterium]|nr:helix-turn-helix transcriptional regulator [Clostridia bacterium]
MNAIKKLRQEANLSQSELADRLKVTQGAVSQWENGLSLPTTDKLIEIANVLDCEISDLLGVSKS